MGFKCSWAGWGHVMVPLSNPAPGSLASSSGAAQCRLELTELYKSVFFPVNNKGNPVIYFHWNHWDGWGKFTQTNKYITVNLKRKKTLSSADLTGKWWVQPSKVKTVFKCRKDFYCCKYKNNRCILQRVCCTLRTHIVLSVSVTFPLFF